MMVVSDKDDGGASGKRGGNGACFKRFCTKATEKNQDIQETRFRRNTYMNKF